MKYAPLAYIDTDTLIIWLKNAQCVLSIGTLMASNKVCNTCSTSLL